MAVLSDHDGGTLITVWVVPGASRDVIDGLHGDALKIRVAAPAERGRANEAVLRLVSARVEAVVELVGGASGRKKTILVRDLDAEQVAAALAL
jgi:uncharacterized protein